MSKDNYEENDERMNVIGQNGNEGLHYAEVDKKQVTHREACEKIADMQVESMSLKELKQYVYEDLVELMFSCNDTFDWYAEEWEWTNE
jgi:hypothetical protein